MLIHYKPVYPGIATPSSVFYPTHNTQGFAGLGGVGSLGCVSIGSISDTPIVFPENETRVHVLIPAPNYRYSSEPPVSFVARALSHGEVELEYQGTKVIVYAECYRDVVMNLKTQIEYEKFHLSRVIERDMILWNR